MATPFVAEIRVFGFNFAPRGWATCDGQILPISQNTALFSLLGVNYGGNGTSNFGLPNLQGSFAMGDGQGPGLRERQVGEAAGSATVSLLASEMPGHSHAVNTASGATQAIPANGVLAPPQTGAPAYRAPGAVAPMAGASLSTAGAGQPHENRQPYLGLNFCIALQGIYPPRS